MMTIEHDLPNCWEIRNCGREKDGKYVGLEGVCPVSELNMGHSCWVVAGSFHDGEPYCPQVKYHGETCTQCEVFSLYCRTGCTNGPEIKNMYPEEEKTYLQLMSERYTRRREIRN